jgi:glycosyltransferase involved in cell wall biosynthesis
MTRTVWILNHYAQAPGGPGGTRHFSLARKLAQYGWQAVIVAASVEHGTGRDRLPSDVKTRLDVIDGVPFLWLKTSDYAGNGPARVRNMLDYTRRALSRSALSSLTRPDVVIGSSVHPLAAWAGARLARRHRVPFVFEVRDLWPQTLVDMGRLKPDGITTRGLRALETGLYQKAKRIVVLLPKADDYIAGLGVSRDKVVWIPNGVDLDAAPENAPSDEPNSEFRLLYLGAHGQANALEPVIDAMSLLETMSLPVPIALHLFGGGPQKDALIDRAKTLGIKNIAFHQAVAKSEVPALAATANAFVLSVRDLPNLYRFGISMNKLFDYMAAGRPIIMAASAANNPIQDAGCGISVPPEDPSRLAEAISTLARMPHSERAEMGAAARRYVVTHHNFETLAARLAATLDEACRP